MECNQKTSDANFRFSEFSIGSFFPITIPRWHFNIYAWLYLKHLCVDIYASLVYPTSHLCVVLHFLLFLTFVGSGQVVKIIGTQNFLKNSPKFLEFLQGVTDLGPKNVNYYLLRLTKTINPAYQHGSMWTLINIITARKPSLRRLCFHRCLFVHMSGGHAWQGHAWRGGHVWWGACMAGVCGGGCMAEGVCVVGGGHAWQGGMCGRGHAWHTHPAGRYYEIRSMSGRYASYWNVFLLVNCLRLTSQNYTKTL